MKKLILTILLAFSTLFSPHGQNITKNDSIDNAVTVEIKFQNPKLNVLVSDQRDEEYINIFAQILNDHLSTNNDLNGTFIKTNEHLDNYMKIQRERKEESAMDYLKRKTNTDEQTIQNILRKYYKITLLTYLILTILLTYTYIKHVIQKVNHPLATTNWGHLLIKESGTIVILYLAYKILHPLLLYLFAFDYVNLEHLIKLTT